MITIFELDRTVHARLIQELGCYIKELSLESDECNHVDVVLSDHVLLKQNGIYTTLDRAGTKAVIESSNYHYIAIS